MSFRERKSYANFDPVPTKKLCTEGDVLIKRLAAKQTLTKIELTSELNKDNPFTSSSLIDPITNHQRGSCTLEELQTQSNKLDDLEVLRSAGFLDCDVKFYTQYRLGKDVFEEVHKKMDKSVLYARIDRLENLLNSYQKKISFIEKSEPARENILLLEKPNSVQTKLLKFSLDNEKPKPYIPNLMDNITSIDSELFSHLKNEIDVEKIRKKTRKLNNRINKLDWKPESNTLASKLDRKSNWDVKTLPKEMNNPRETKTHSCTPSNYYTVRNGEIIKLTENNRIPASLYQEKLSVEDIRNLPKFSNYAISNPSAVIYVQNLARSVTENDLKTIFQRFDSNITSYKLLNGRLKGRAFITFEDISSCSIAFEALNGIFFKAKPLIFEYGKGVG